MNIKSDCGQEIYDKDGLSIKITCESGVQVIWELSKEEELELANYLCAKHDLSRFWFDMYQEERDKNSELFTNYFSLTKKYQELADILVNIPVLKASNEWISLMKNKASFDEMQSYLDKSEGKQ